MKLPAQPCPWPRLLEAAVPAEPDRSAAATPAIVPPAPRRRSAAGADTCSRSLRLVGILAFCHSLLFLLLWLFLCAHAGAAAPAAEFNPQLQLSSYQPAQQRDPFLSGLTRRPEVKVAAGVPVTFNLQGILYDPTNPSAIINDQLVTLNRPVKFGGDKSGVAAKAIEITRERVVLEVDGQKVELQLSNPGTSPPAKP